MKKIISLLGLLGLMLFLGGCASTQSNLAPGVDVTTLQTFFVEKLPADNRGVERMISDDLNLRGFESTYGPALPADSPVDALVTYQDRWTWDITMYMLRLDVQVRDPQTRRVLASAQSYRPSLQRRSPENMVNEVLNEIFGN
jgi:hypothetical protein